MSTLATLIAALPTPTAATTPKVAAPAIVMPDGLTATEQRIYAFAASQSSASPEARWAWRKLHAQLALGRTAWAVDTQTWVHTAMPWNAANSVPAEVRAAEAQSAQLYAACAQEMRAQRLEQLAERIAAAFERVADTLAPVAPPPAPVSQLPDAVEARFVAIEAANKAQGELLAKIAAKIGATP